MCVFNCPICQSGGFFNSIFTDYKAAVLDAVQDMKDAPRKATFYISLLTSGAVLAKTSPSESHFETALSDCHHDLLLLGDPIRNRQSDDHIQTIQMYYREGRIRYTNCGLFSLIWLAGYKPAVDTFDARCKLVRPQWLDFHKQVLDVGVLGRWFYLRKAMHEFDVNPDEWDAEGHRVKSTPTAIGVQETQ